MSLDSLKEHLPDYAKDLRLNLGAIPTVTTLNPQQLWGTVLVSALATKNQAVVQAALAASAPALNEAARSAVYSAASIMAMNNIYYRFTHLVGNETYATMPARLRMNVIGNPGVDKADFELWCLAASAVEGCGRCIEAHEAELVKRGTTRETIQDAVRIAAILNGVAATITMESQSKAA